MLLRVAPRAQFSSATSPKKWRMRVFWEGLRAHGVFGALASLFRKPIPKFAMEGQPQPLTEDAIVQSVLRAYESLPKKGKPDASKDEWTVLAAFIVEHASIASPVVVSLGTGTKCLSRSQRAPHLIADSHAEVIARRAFVLQILHHARLNDAISFWNADGTWNAEIRVWLYTSKEPCGASRSMISDAHENKRIKCGLLEPIRKPGKGDATQSVSCADKIAKWASARGIVSPKQRAHAVPLSGVIVGGSFENHDTFSEMLDAAAGDGTECKLVHTRIPFVHDTPKNENAHPSGLSINWIMSDGKNASEVTQPNGKKMGANAGAPMNPKHVSRLAATMHRKLL